MVAATRGCGSSQKGCGFRGTLFIYCIKSNGANIMDEMKYSPRYQSGHQRGGSGLLDQGPGLGN